MPEQIFKQPSRRRQDEDEAQGWQPPSTTNEQSSRVSEDADKTLGNIDDVLGEHNTDRPHDTFRDRNEEFREPGSEGKRSSGLRDGNLSDVASREQHPKRPGEGVEAAAGGGKAAYAVNSARKGLGKAAQFRDFLKTRKGKVAAGGALGAIVLAIMLIIFALLNAIIHLSENLRLKSNPFKRQRLAWRLAAPKNYAIAFDKEGRIAGYYKNSNIPLVNHLRKVNTRKIAQDLRAAGMNVEFDEKTGKLSKINGKDVGNMDKPDQRALFNNEMDELERKFPHTQYMLRSVNIKRVHAMYGIKKVYFEKTKTKAKNLKERWRIKIRDRLFGSAPEAARYQYQQDQESPDPVIDEAQELSDEITDAADDLKEEALNDPSKAVPEPDLNISEADALKKVGGRLAQVGVAGSGRIAADACMIKLTLRVVEVGARHARYVAIIRLMGTIAVAGDQLKTGQDVTGEEIGAMTLAFSGFAAAGGFQKITGMNPNAKNSAPEKTNINRGLVGRLAQINNSLDAIPGLKTGCKILTHPATQIGLGVISIGGAIFTGGGTRAGEIAIAAGLAGTFALAEAIAIPIAIQMIAGMPVTGDEDGKTLGEISVAGAEALGNEQLRGQGAHRLSSAEANRLNKIAEAAEQEDLKRQSFFARFIDPRKPTSLAAKAIFETPFFSLATATLEPVNLVTDFRPLSFTSNFISGTLLGKSAYAGVSSQDTSDYGIEQYGIDPKYDTLENAKWVYDEHREEYNEYVENCVKSTDPETVNSDDCTDIDEKKERFAQYMFEEDMAFGMAYMTGGYDELLDPSAGTFDL